VKRAPHGFLARNSEVFLKNLPAPAAPLPFRGRIGDRGLYGIERRKQKTRQQRQRVWCSLTI